METVETTAIPSGWNFGDDTLAPAGTVRLTAFNKITGEIYSRFHRTAEAARKSVAKLGSDWSVKAYSILTGGYDGNSELIRL